VQFQFLAAPVRAKSKDGRLSGVECIRMKLGEADASGRRRPVPIPGSEFTVPADTLLGAIGEGPDFEALGADLDHDDWTLATDAFGTTTDARITAGGDIIDQPHTVAHALGAGKRAAVAIDARLRREAGETVDAPDLAALRYGRLGNVTATRWRGDDPVVRNGAVNKVVPYEELNPAHFTPVRVHPDRRLSVERSLEGFDEVNLGLTRELAMAEARRCFNCGVCNRCELCLIFCPDVAISRRPDGTGFEIDYDHCKGCGLCNAECPRGAMAMTREGL